MDIVSICLRLNCVKLPFCKSKSVMWHQLHWFNLKKLAKGRCCCRAECTERAVVNTTVPFSLFPWIHLSNSLLVVCKKENHQESNKVMYTVNLKCWIKTLKHRWLSSTSYLDGCVLQALDVFIISYVILNGRLQLSKFSKNGLSWSPDL